MKHGKGVDSGEANEGGVYFMEMPGESLLLRKHLNRTLKEVREWAR